MGGGALRTLSHEIDLAYYFFGPLDAVTARVQKVSALEMDADDIALIWTGNKTCAMIRIYMDLLSPVLRRQGHILFSKGLMSYDFVSGHVYFQDNHQSQRQTLYAALEPYDRQYEIQMRHFLDGNTAVGCSLRDGAYVLKVIDACLRSNEKGAEQCLD